MEAEDILWVLPYFILAAILYSIYIWKTVRGKSLLKEAHALITAGNHNDGITQLKQALWKSNECPRTERTILKELSSVYQERSIPFDDHDYLTLIDQYKGLAKKGSTKAFEELKKVQALKKKLIDSMPDIT